MSGGSPLSFPASPNYIPASFESADLTVPSLTEPAFDGNETSRLVTDVTVWHVKSVRKEDT